MGLSKALNFGQTEWFDTNNMRRVSTNTTGYDMLRVSTRVVDSTQGVWAVVAPMYQSMAYDWAMKLSELMRDRVRPGVGPGPHPHPGRTDTGHAAAAITVKEMPAENKSQLSSPRYHDQLSSSKWAAGIFSDAGGTLRGKGTSPFEYMAYLEFGWTARNGKRYQYPWAAPALADFYGSNIMLNRQLTQIGFKLDRGSRFTSPLR
jgi:hypothetical protein